MRYRPLCIQLGLGGMAAQPSVLPVNANLFVPRLPHGPEGPEDMHVEHWICSECGAEHERDANAAISLRRLGLAEAEVSAGTWCPYLLLGSTASTVVEP
jgi:hypothetical protein